MSSAFLTAPLRKLPALSIRQPWVWAIMHCGKPVENRDWSTCYRGQFLIHASKSGTRKEWRNDIDSIRIMCEMSGEPLDELKIPAMDEVPRGGIVAAAWITNCVRQMDSAWFVGPYGFQLEGVTPLPFVPCRGKLNFFYPTFESVFEPATS